MGRISDICFCISVLFCRADHLGQYLQCHIMAEQSFRVNGQYRRIFLPVPDKIGTTSDFFQIRRVTDSFKPEGAGIVMNLFVNFIKLVSTDDTVVGVSPEVCFHQYFSCRICLGFCETEFGLREYLFAQLN